MELDQDKIPSLKSENLSERVVLWLKKAILDGSFRPGDELPSEQELCNLLGVGKSSIREALKMLQMIGVVEIRQGKRSRICETVKTNVMMPLIFNLIMQESTPQDMYDFRSMFEKAVVEYAMEHAKEEDVELLKSELERFRQKDREGTATLEDDFSFHRVLLEICKNPFILQIGTLLLDLFSNPMAKASHYDSSRALHDHELILTAILEHNEKGMHDILDESFEVYREALGIDH